MKFKNRVQQSYELPHIKLAHSLNTVYLRFSHSSFGAPSLLNFFIFILRFWNQILTCLSVRFNSLATSYLRSLVR